MIYLKENNNPILKYTDFLAHQDKIEIDGKDLNIEIISLEGIEDIHKYAKDIRIGNAEITNLSNISKIKSIESLQLYSIPTLRNLNGLKDLKLKFLTLYDLKNLESFGDAKFETDSLVLHNCPKLDINLSNIKINDTLSLTNVSLKDLSFLKEMKLKEISITNSKLETLYGIQYSPQTVIKFYNNGSNASNFDYHNIFYKGSKQLNKPITDYWKELYQFWIDSITEDGKKELDPKDMVDIINDIQMPKEDIKRIFTEDEQRLISGQKVINKFNL